MDCDSRDGRITGKEQSMSMPIKRAVTLVVSGCLIASAAAAQQFVYPAKGQSPEQQKKDEYECHQWAVQQTGVDPSKPAPQTAAAPSSPQTATGVTPGAGVRGAARGAVVGEIIADDAGAGAAVGAAAARGQSRRQNRQQAAQQQQQQQQAQGNQNASYAKARAACLEGRGYSVK
jgi:hypothetical protein